MLPQTIEYTVQNHRTPSPRNRFGLKNTLHPVISSASLSKLIQQTTIYFPYKEFPSHRFDQNLRFFGPLTIPFNKMLHLPFILEEKIVKTFEAYIYSYIYLLYKSM